MLDAQRVRDVLDYDPVTGVFRWKMLTSKQVHRAHVGDEAGAPDKLGYRMIGIDRKVYLSHRLAWVWMTGEWPLIDIDHANGDPSDNRWCNLREATESQNKANTGPQKNNTSGFKGVYWVKSHKKWSALIRKDKKLRFLGYFDTPEAAHAVYAAEASKLFGEFARTA